MLARTFVFFYLKPIKQGEVRFRKQSENIRRLANSRAAVLKRGFSVANDASEPVTTRSAPSPPKWLQRAQSVQNLPDWSECQNDNADIALTGSLVSYLLINLSNLKG